MPSLQNIPFSSHLYSYHWQFAGAGILTFPNMKYEILQHLLLQNLTVSRGGAAPSCTTTILEPLCDSSQPLMFTLASSSAYRAAGVCNIPLGDFDWFEIKGEARKRVKTRLFYCTCKKKKKETWLKVTTVIWGEDEKNHLIFGTRVDKNIAGEMFLKKKHITLVSLSVTV